MDPEQIAKEAIAEAWDILVLLADFTHNSAWCQNSRPQVKLDRLAQGLGYKTAQALADEKRFDEECFDGPGPFP